MEMAEDYPAAVVRIPHLTTGGISVTCSSL